MIRELFKNKATGFYVALAASGVALVADVLFIALDGSDRTFSLAAFILMLVGALAIALPLFTRVKFAPLVQAALFIVGFALELNATLPSVSDLWNGVNFIGGNATLGIIFTAVFLLCTVASVVSCFMEQNKPYGARAVSAE